jgi:hypothetical protein
MRNLFIVCLLVLSACTTMTPRPAAQNEQVVRVCRSDRAIPECHYLNLAEYEAMLRNLNRSLSAAHLGR